MIKFGTLDDDVIKATANNKPTNEHNFPRNRCLMPTFGSISPVTGCSFIANFGAVF